MNITLPKDPRDVPNAREIEDVLRVVCQKAGLKPDSISFTVADNLSKIALPVVSEVTAAALQPRTSRSIVRALSMGRKANGARK